MSKRKKSGRTIRYYNRTFDFISNLPFKSAPSLYKSIPIEPTVFKKPPTGVEDIKWNIHPKAPEQFLATIPKGTIWGPNGSVIAPDHKLLWDVSSEYYSNPKDASSF